MIYGLVGYAGTGKDTVGRLMVENHNFKRVAFADKLKELALAVNPDIHNGIEGIPLKSWVDWGGWDKAKQDELVRGFLQKLGVAVREVLGKNTWINAAIDTMGTTDLNIVITDVRFINEANMIREHFKDEPVRMIRIWRPEHGPLNGHVSETELDLIRCDHNLVNDGTIEDLERKVRALVIDDTVLV